MLFLFRMLTSFPWLSSVEIFLCTIECIPVLISSIQQLCNSTLTFFKSIIRRFPLYRDIYGGLYWLCCSNVQLLITAVRILLPAMQVSQAKDPIQSFPLVNPHYCLEDSDFSSMTIDQCLFYLESSYYRYRFEQVPLNRQTLQSSMLTLLYKVCCRVVLCRVM